MSESDYLLSPIFLYRDLVSKQEHKQKSWCQNLKGSDRICLVCVLNSVLCGLLVFVSFCHIRSGILFLYLTYLHTEIRFILNKCRSNTFHPTTCISAIDLITIPWGSSWDAIFLTAIMVIQAFFSAWCLIKWDINVKSTVMWISWGKFPDHYQKW